MGQKIGGDVAKAKKNNKKRTPVVRLSPEMKLKRSIRAHFRKLGFAKDDEGALVRPDGGKDTVRELHRVQREERLAQSADWLKATMPEALPYFADGGEIDPNKIDLSLVRVDPGTFDADLFRLASLTWSVPVSNGYGRRLRYLVWDSHHDRIAGIAALGDPVFNLGVRDSLIGWDAEDRSRRLVNMLDAYVLGAVPPYNFLLGGKAVASLVRSRQVYNDFTRTYGSATGIISGEDKHARLLAVTTSSSMGRSSVYNRLRLNGAEYFSPIGYTLGWGHFHITDDLFAQMRDYLRLIKHPYADRHRFGQGPNWRMRTIRSALRELGVNESVLRHGIQREVFLCTYAVNALRILKTGKGRPDLSTLEEVGDIARMVRERWMAPRALRRPEFTDWRRDDIRNLIHGRSFVWPRRSLAA